jgi:hypothetical protein
MLRDYPRNYSEGMDAKEPVEQAIARYTVTGFASRYEDRHPNWLVDHALTAGWLWAALWILLLVPADHYNWHHWIWFVIAIVAVLPTFTATILVLSQTPHSHLRRSESVLGHFFARFAGWVFAFLAWTISVVLSATIASQLQAEGKNNELTTLGLGLNLLLASAPVVIVFLWVVLLVRCSWFLSRLRGWRARPEHTRIPKSFLAESPRTHRLIVGLAHPGLFLATCLLATIIGGLLYVDDVTINII